MQRRSRPSSRPPDSAYHTQAAHDARLAARLANRITPYPLHVYYHMALMPGWRSLVPEQLRLFSFVGLSRITACCLGSPEDAAEAIDLAEWYGLELIVVYQSPNFREYEQPTLRALWEHACRDQAAAFLYLHTKGVSSPTDACKVQWRRVMERYLIADWRKNLSHLSEYDMVGCNWQEARDFPHYQGNYWMARGDWLANLQDPRDYRDQNMHVRFACQDWARMHAEPWIGSKPWHHYLSLVCTSHTWYRRKEDTDYVYQPIEGFDYDAGYPELARTHAP